MVRRSRTRSISGRGTAQQKQQDRVGKEVYTLAGHEAELDRYAAQTVTVKGAVSGKAVTVTSVAAAAKAP